MGFAHTTIQVYFIAIVQGVEAISWTAGRSLLSKMVETEDQGALFSVAAAIQSCTSLLASVLWPLFYPLTLQAENLPTGFIYLAMAMLDVLAFPLIFVLILSEYWKRKQERDKTENFNETDRLLSNAQNSSDDKETTGTNQSTSEF